MAESASKAMKHYDEKIKEFDRKRREEIYVLPKAGTPEDLIARPGELFRISGAVASAFEKGYFYRIGSRGNHSYDIYVSKYFSKNLWGSRALVAYNLQMSVDDAEYGTHSYAWLAVRGLFVPSDAIITPTPSCWQHPELMPRYWESLRASPVES